MTVPKYFRKTGERAISSFDYYDIAEGTGIKSFYILKIWEDGVEKNIISSQSIYSSSIEHSDGPDVVGTSYTKTMDTDFDLSPFNLPKTIEGDAYISFSWWVTYTVSAAPYWYYNIIVKKVSGGVETTMGSSSSEVIGVASNGTATQTSLKIALANTHFKKGDILRVTFEGWAKNTEGVDPTATFKFGVDPQNRDGDNIVPSTDDPATTTKCQLYIPFVLDL